MKGKVVYLVDDIETSFVINDIRRVSREFDQVFLLSIDKIDRPEILPDNVVVIDEFMDWKRYSKASILMKHFLAMLTLYFKECLALRKWLPFKASLALIASNIFKANELLRRLKEKEPDLKDIRLFYSFWFYDCIYLAWLKRKVNVPMVTRTHSGDLYEDHISIRDNVLMRHFQFSKLDAVYPVSDMGTDYLKMRYPKFEFKIKTIFLGTTDYACMNPFNPNEIVMVSCASFRHHKRIHKIAEALLKVNTPITWLHFGNENLHTNDPKIPEYLEMKSRLKDEKPNVKYVPMGLMENERLMEFYQNNQVSFFISLSAAEGIPVSIMEAMSFGIPVLSTDVGGCSEIVNASTGHLIPLNTPLDVISSWIDDFQKSPMNTLTFREGVRHFWKNRFDSESNYKVFFESIEKLIQGN